MASSMWAQAAGHVRAARLLMRTGQQGWGHADRQGVKELTWEVAALERTLVYYRRCAGLPVRAEESEGLSDGEGEGADGVGGLAAHPLSVNEDGVEEAVEEEQQQQVDAASTTTGVPSESTGQDPLSLMDFLARLTRTTPELVEAICEHMLEEGKGALGASCRAGRDAVRAATTDLTMSAHNIDLPQQDLSITHPRLQHLTLCLNSHHPYLPTDLAAATPAVFRQLKSLTLSWHSLYGDSGAPPAMLRELRQLVGLCTQLSMLEVGDGRVRLIFEAPPYQCLHPDDLGIVFKKQRLDCVQWVATPVAEKYLTQAYLFDEEVEISLVDALWRCSRLQRLDISSPLVQLPHDLSALLQLMHLDIVLSASAEMCASLRVLQDLPQLESLTICIRHEVEEEDDEPPLVDPPPASLQLPALRRLVLALHGEENNSFVNCLMAAISAPQLCNMNVTGDWPLPISLMLEFASRHPALKMEGPFGKSQFSATGKQLVEAAHLVPDLLNYSVMFMHNSCPGEAGAAVRAVGTQLHHLELEPDLRDGEVDVFGLDDSLLQEIATACPNVKHINICSGCTEGFTSLGVSALAGSLPGLEVLKLFGNGDDQAFDDSCIRSLGIGCPLLSELVLPLGAESVSDDAVVELCTAAPRLCRDTLEVGDESDDDVIEELWQRIEESRAMVRSG